jgi:hypothetical protein
MAMHSHNYDSIYNTYSTKDLERLLKSAPYFAMAQSVLAKKYFDEKNIAFNEQLKIASLYSTNRKLLYHYIHQAKTETVSIAPLLTVVKELVTTTNIVTSKTNNSALEALVANVILSDEKLETTTNASTDALTKLVNNVVLNDSTTTTESTIPEIIQLTQPITIATIEPVSETKIELVLEPTKTVETIASVDVVAKGLMPVIEPEIIQNSAEENTSTNNETEAITSVETIVDEAITTETSLPITKTYKPIHISDTGSFFEWLNVGNNSVLEFEETIESKNIETKVNVAPTVKPISTEQHNAETKKRKKSLIEKFIIDEPRITPAKAKMYNPVTKAKESVEENDDLVSETLVKIYVQQGMYRKAVKSLEKLGEKYPEKKTYFASQIIKIREYLASNNIKY